MTSLRDQLAHDISHGQLGQDDNEETSADRIGALARTDPLGAALWRVSGNLDANSFIYARGLLVDALYGPLASREATRRVAQKAMEEWLVCLCDTCSGHRFIHTDTGVKVKCPACGGSGKGTHSADERIRWLGCTPGVYAQLSGLFDKAHELLSRADARVAGQLSYQLERRKPLKKKAKG